MIILIWENAKINKMKTDGHDELEEMLEQLKSLPRAKPSPNLLGRIESRIARAEAKVIPLAQWRLSAAAALVVVSLNVYALTAYANGSNGQTASSDYDASSLVSDYQLYE